MIKIEVYRLFDKTVGTIDVSSVVGQGEPDAHTHWTNLAYESAPFLAHDEGGQLTDLVSSLIETAGERAGGLGGWGLLT